ncbi:MAG: glycosyltransferase family 2 protein [Desulfobacterales bacterium]|nr:glycosyltransferase family 2 protein [Desulfobacterales bacterium]
MRGGIAAARGRYIIMGDADDSYDFSRLRRFPERAARRSRSRHGQPLPGRHPAGAMPPLHHRLGNPLLSFIGRLFFKIRVHDFHCGLRGFNAQAIRALDLRTPGMEFASEMVVRAALEELKVVEVPTTLSPDGRSRPPHLRTWRDGWRHLKFLLTYSPALALPLPRRRVLLALGAAVIALLLPGPCGWAGSASKTRPSSPAACACWWGCRASPSRCWSGATPRARGICRGTGAMRRFSSNLTLERLALAALALFVAGCGGVAWCFVSWWGAFFGPFDSPMATRLMVLSITLLAAATQIFLTAFLGAIMDVGNEIGPRAPQAG